MSASATQGGHNKSQAASRVGAVLHFLCGEELHDSKGVSRLVAACDKSIPLGLKLLKWNQQHKA